MVGFYSEMGRFYGTLAPALCGDFRRGAGQLILLDEPAILSCSQLKAWFGWISLQVVIARQ